MRTRITPSAGVDRVMVAVGVFRVSPRLVIVRVAASTDSSVGVASTSRTWRAVRTWKPSRTIQ